MHSQHHPGTESTDPAAAATGAAALVHQFADPALAISADGRVLAINEGAEVLLADRGGDVIGASCADVVDAIDGAGEHVCRATDCPILACFRAGHPTALDWNAVALRDGEVPVSASAFIVPESQRGDGTSAILTLRVARAHIDPLPAEPQVLDIRLLGATEIMRGAERLPRPERRKTIELLALLATEHAGVHRDRLLESLWPGEAPDHTAPRLRVVLHDARRLLERVGEGEALRRDGAIHSLEPSDSVAFDWLEFDATARAIARQDNGHAADAVSLERALTLYRGDFAADEPFGEWAVAVRESLRRHYHDVLEIAALRFAHLGAIARSVECCERALRSDPMQEQFHLALITYYGQLGRRADAMRQYRDYQRVLATELGGRPSPATERALRRALRPESSTSGS